MYHVYVLQNPDGIFYKGQTNNLNKRITEHNMIDGPSSYTRKKGPWKLVYSEEFPTRSMAMAREKFFKTGKGRDFIREKLEADS